MKTIDERETQKKKRKKQETNKKNKDRKEQGGRSYSEKVRTK